MKFKYFLRGFGIGIIFTAIIVAILHTSEKNVMSDREIIEQAKKLGMVASNEKDMDFLESATPTAAPTLEPTEKVKEIVVTLTPKAKETQKAKETSKPEKTKNNTPTPDKAGDSKEETISITIESGMWSGKICQKLEELGVVDNAEEFDEYLCENGYESNIKPGIYQIKKGVSYEEIAKALIK